MGWIASGVLQQNAFEDVGHILTAIRTLFKTLVNLFPLHDNHRILFAIEQPGDGVTGDAIRIVLQAVDRDEAGVQIGRLTQLGDATSEFIARAVNNIGQLDRFLRRFLDFVYYHPVRYSFYAIQTVSSRSWQSL